MSRRNRNELGDLPSDQFRGPTKEVVGYGGPQGILGPTGSSSAYINDVAMNNRVYAVTDITSRVLPANRKRKYLILVNTGGVVVYVSFSGSNNLANSIPIPVGGNYEPWIIPYSEVYAITDTGGISSLVIAEGFVEGA